MNQTTLAKTVSPVASRISSSAANLVVHGSNQMKFVDCKLYFYPSQFLWKRMQRLHQVAQGTRADGRHLPPAQAAAAYHEALMAAMGQMLVMADIDRLKQFDHLLDVITSTRSFQGLGTPFLTFLNTAGLHKDKARLDRGTQLWHQYGNTAHLGAKLTTAYLIDGSTQTIIAISATHLQAMGPGGAKASVMVSANIGHLAVQVQGAGLFDAGVAQDGDSCKGGWKLAGGIVGAIIGGSASGAATLGTTTAGGAVVGFGAGVAAGDVVGDFMCGKGSADGGVGGAGGGSTGPIIDPGAGPGDGPTDGSSVDNSSESGNEQNYSSEGQNQSTQDEQNQSGGNDGSGDNSGSGDDHDNGGGGMPNPDDPHGFPSPDDPHGMVAFSDTYPQGAAADAMIGHASTGAWICQGTPQLTAAGGLAVAGMLAAIPGVTALVGAQAGPASLAGLAQVGASQASKLGLAGNIAAAAGLANVANVAQQAKAAAGKQALP